MLVAGSGLLAAAAFGTAGQPGVREGGLFRVVGSTGNIDPAIVDADPVLFALLDATCAHLMTYPSGRGYRLEPEVAAQPPRVSPDGRTYTFVLRRNFRFNTRAPVRASAFAWAITRELRLVASGVDVEDVNGVAYALGIVGAQEVADGKAPTVSGIHASGNRLVIRLIRPTPDFPAQLTSFCAVPPTLPPDPEGRLTFPAAGPYYVAAHVRGRSIVLRRNKFYGGLRPHHVASFVVTESDEDPLDRIERGAADWGWAAAPRYFDPSRRLAAKYGVNKSQFWVRPGLALLYFPLNSRRPLFRNNPWLRRAVNFAIDRAAVSRELARSNLAARLTDQYLPPGSFGFRDAHIYPLKRPNLRRARALASGHRRGGKVSLYVVNISRAISAAQVVKRNLARIGLDVEVIVIPAGPAFIERLLQPDEPWDMALTAWAPTYFDPYSYLNELFGRKFIGISNLGRFDVARYNRALTRAARRQGKSRYRAYGALDVRLARYAAPAVAIHYASEPTLVSKRVDKRCIAERFDLTAVCLKR